MNFIYGHDEIVGDFIRQFPGRGGIEFGRCKSIGVIDDEGKLIAGVVFHNYDDAADVIEFGCAAIDKRWLSRATLKRMFEYPFIECGCQMVFARARSDDTALLSILARLNFNLTLIPRMFGRDIDGVIGTLTDDQWLDNKFSQRFYRDAKREAA